jgi:LmbE family N-acetylglucosaminyl deacetylase
VTVVFLTDGAGSHAHLVASDELARRRRGEALAACAELGVAESAIRFLEIRDGSLEARAAEAVEQLTAILDDAVDAQLVAPHPAEAPRDHHAAYGIVRDAVERGGRQHDALLYPVWMWDQFPWTNPFAPPRARHSRRQIVRIACRDRLGSRLIHELDRRVDVSGVLDVKRAALAAHRSQMERENGRPDWSTLSDVAHGDWLAQLTRSTEYYTARRLGPSDHRPHRSPPVPQGARSR